MTEWQPIETAPRDGRWFLGGRKTDYDLVGGATFWAAAMRFEYDYDVCPEMMMANGEWGPSVTVTHWMPLPPPPAETSPKTQAT